MKKSMLFGSLLMLAFSPLYLCAQEIQLPTFEVKVSQDRVPLKVKEAILKNFGEGHQPIAWVTPQSLIDTYWWEQSVNIDNEDVYTYSIHTKTTNGWTLDAFYTADGKLINSVETLKNFRPDEKILLAVQNSEFKDWGIKSDLHVIKTTSRGAEKQRYALIMMKGNTKRTLHFNTNGDIMSNKEVALADANW